MKQSRMFSFLFITVFIFSLSVTSVSAATNSVMNIGAVKGVNINGTELTVPEGMGHFFIDSSGRTMAPVNILCKSLGYPVSWDQNGKKVTIIGGSNGTIQIVIGQNYLLVGNQQIPLDTEATIIDGRTYVPIRAVSEALNFTVNWNSGIVFITNGNGQGAPASGVGDKSLSQCVNFQVAVAASDYKYATYQQEVWKVLYQDPTGSFRDFSLRYSGNQKYGVDGLSFGDIGAKQLPIVFGLLKDVVEPVGADGIIKKLTERQEILSTGWTKESGFSSVAKQYISDNRNKTFTFGKVSFTFGQDTSQFIITTAP